MLLNNDIYNLYCRSPYPQLAMYILSLYIAIVVLISFLPEPFSMYYINCHRYRVCNIVNCITYCRYIAPIYALYRLRAGLYIYTIYTRYILAVCNVDILTRQPPLSLSTVQR